MFGDLRKRRRFENSRISNLQTGELGLLTLKTLLRLHLLTCEKGGWASRVRTATTDPSHFIFFSNRSDQNHRPIDDFSAEDLRNDLDINFISGFLTSKVRICDSGPVTQGISDASKICRILDTQTMYDGEVVSRVSSRTQVPVLRRGSDSPFYIV